MAARTLMMLAVLLTASPAFSASTNRIKRDKATGQQHQDLGRPSSSPAGYWYAGPHASANPVNQHAGRSRFHPAVAYYRPHRAVMQQQHKQTATGTYWRRPHHINNYRLLLPAAAPYAQQQVRQPQTLPVPLPIQLTPSGVVLPTPPKQNGGYLSGSASAQTPYLGPFNKQPNAQPVRPVQPPPLVARQPQQVAPPVKVTPIQPPPNYARDPKQTSVVQQSLTASSDVKQQSVAPIQPPPLYNRDQPSGPSQQLSNEIQNVPALQPPPLYVRDPQSGSSPAHSNEVHSAAPIQPPPLFARDPQSGSSPSQSNDVQSVAPIQPPPLYSRDPQSGGASQSLGNNIQVDNVAPIQPPPLYSRDPQSGGSSQSLGNSIQQENVAPIQPPPLFARDPSSGSSQSVSNDIQVQNAAPIQPPPLYAREPQSGSSQSFSNDVQQEAVAPIQPPPLIAREPQSGNNNAVDLSNVAPLQPPPLYARDPALQSVESAPLTNDISLSETQQTSHSQASSNAAVEPIQPPPLYSRQPSAGSSSSLDSVQALQPAPLYARQPSGLGADLNLEDSFQPISGPGNEEAAGSYAPGSPVTIPPTSSLSNDELSDDNLSVPPPPPPSIEFNALAAGPASTGSSGGDSQWSEGSIPWTLEKLGFNTLNDLLVLSGTDETLDKGGPFTVFVPVDQAFEILISKLGGMEVATAAFDKDPELLTSLLKHHVLPGVVPSSALQDNMVAQSLLGTPLRVKFYESEDSEWRPLKVITVNGARLLKPDIQATNGMIHIVDRVLFPVPQADIYSTLKGDPQQRYTTLVSAIERAGLTSVLANPTGGPYTVFAPTDKAFSLISRSELNKMLNDPDRLTKLLQRHVVQDLIYTSGLQGFQKAYTLDFELIYIYHAKGMTKVNGANVVDQDVTALNGVIHSIDSVLGIN